MDTRTELILRAAALNYFLGEDDFTPEQREELGSVLGWNEED